MQSKVQEQQPKVSAYVLAPASDLPPLESVQGPDDFIPYWTRLVELYKERQEIPLAAILESRVLEWRPPATLKIPYFGPLEQERLQKVLSDVERWLRHCTGLEGLVLELFYTEDESSIKAKPLSDRDRYEVLRAKNPVLDLLKQRLAMEFS